MRSYIRTTSTQPARTYANSAKRPRPRNAQPSPRHQRDELADETNLGKKGPEMLIETPPSIACASVSQTPVEMLRLPAAVQNTIGLSRGAASNALKWVRPDLTLRHSEICRGQSTNQVYSTGVPRAAFKFEQAIKQDRIARPWRGPALQVVSAVWLDRRPSVLTGGQPEG